MPIYFNNGRIFIPSNIAMGEACCECLEWFNAFSTTGLKGSNLEFGDSAYATIDAPNCLILKDRILPLTVTQSGSVPIYQEFELQNQEVFECLDNLVSIGFNLRCNLDLEIREGQEPTDQFELEMYYFQISDVSFREWVRVELGSTLFPLMLEFKIKPPVLEDGYNCCETEDAITVVVTE